MQQHSRAILVASVLVVLAASVCGRPQTGGRRLLNPIYTQNKNLVEPEKPSWDSFDNKPPAKHTYTSKTSSEKPFVRIQHNDTKTHESKSTHTSQGTEQGKSSSTVGKGGAEMVFTSGKRFFSHTTGSVSTLAMPQTVIAASGGMPLVAEHVSSYENYGPNATRVFALGSGPVYNSRYNMTAGPEVVGAFHHGRRLRSLLSRAAEAVPALRRLL